MKNIIRNSVNLLLLLSAFVVGLAQAAGSALSISPGGLLSTVSNVPVEVTLSNPNNYQIRTFSVKLNGADVTSAFISAAALTTTGTTAKARVEYLFGPGTYSIATRAELVSPDGNTVEVLTANSDFTVPGDQQEQRKNTVLSRVEQYLHNWDAYDFHSSISLGNMSVFTSRANDAAFQVYVDAWYNLWAGDALSDAAAAYVEKYIWKQVWTIYDQDLILRDEPQNVDPSTLWHEMIHAVNHGAQVSSSPSALSGDDHVHIGYAEGCTQNLTKLVLFETLVNRYGKANPTPTQAAEARTKWKDFLRERAKSSYSELGAISAAQIAELERLIGFRCDANTIKQGYLNLGYSPLYFADLTVTITSPSSGTETSSNQVKVTATVTNNEPDIVLDKAGFSINGAIQLAPFSGSSFETTAVLKTGDNSILAGVQSTDGQLFTSTPITVKSNALNNTYHARITWDKNDTDVDLHFSWSGGSECFYSNKTPTWGGSAATSPRLDVDDTNGFGPENITIGALPGPGTYRLWVYYYSDHDKGGTNVNAAIYKDGVPIYSSSRYMSNHESWTLIELVIP